MVCACAQGAGSESQQGHYGTLRSAFSIRESVMAGEGRSGAGGGNEESVEEGMEDRRDGS